MPQNPEVFQTSFWSIDIPSAPRRRPKPSHLPKKKPSSLDTVPLPTLWDQQPAPQLRERARDSCEDPSWNPSAFAQLALIAEPNATYSANLERQQTIKKPKKARSYQQPTSHDQKKSSPENRPRHRSETGKLYDKIHTILEDLFLYPDIATILANSDEAICIYDTEGGQQFLAQRNPDGTYHVRHIDQFSAGSNRLFQAVVFISGVISEFDRYTLKNQAEDWAARLVPHSWMAFIEHRTHFEPSDSQKKHHKILVPAGYKQIGLNPLAPHLSHGYWPVLAKSMAIDVARQTREPATVAPPDEVLTPAQDIEILVGGVVMGLTELFESAAFSGRPEDQPHNSLDTQLQTPLTHEEQILQLISILGLGVSSNVIYTVTIAADQSGHNRNGLWVEVHMQDSAYSNDSKNFQHRFIPTVELPLVLSLLGEKGSIAFTAPIFLVD